MKKIKKIWLAGHRGLVGSAILRSLKLRKYEIITATSTNLDLRNKIKVNNFIKNNSPDLIILSAGKVGGILANSTQPLSFLYDNLSIVSNVIKCAHDNSIRNLIYLGSSCIYPNNVKTKINEDMLLTGKLEKTNEWYALAKIVGVKLCEAISKNKDFNYISVMPTNVYGPNDNFHPTQSHVMPALIRRFIEAKKNNNKEIVIWGTGKPKREFIHSYDLAEAIMFIIEKNFKGNIINVGVGHDLRILDLVNILRKLTNFNGKILFDHSKPDGTFRKLLDISKIKSLGWNYKIELKDGIFSTINWYEKKYLS